MDRRSFNKGAALGCGIMLLKPRTAFSYQANSTVHLALLGCGLRGTAVATSFVKNTNTRLVALADLFPDQLAKARTHFDGLGSSLGHSPIASHNLFTGEQAAQAVAACKDVDAVQISTPPWFHVDHLGIVVRSGKHAYCEKPLGVDVPQTRRALEIGAMAEGKLSLEVGFQLRSAPPFAAAVDRIHKGAIGKVAVIDAHYNAPAPTYLEMPNISPDELRIRRWKWDRVLSGGNLLEQGIHVLDMCNWVQNKHPQSAIANGGRTVISHEGDSWDNYQVIYSYPEDSRVAFSSTQFGERSWGFDVKERIFGSDGIAEIAYSGPVKIVGQQSWSWSQPPAGQEPSAAFPSNGAFSDNLAQADSEKEKSFIDSIVSGKFHNQAKHGVESTLTAMLGRQAAEKKQSISWDELLQSNEELRLNINMKQFS